MVRNSLRLSLRLLIPVFIAGGCMLLLCACTKKNVAVPAVGVPVPANTDSMSVTGTKKYLALGDSYTIGTSVSEGDRYPLQTAAILKAGGIDMAPVYIIATNGWTTANLLSAINTSTLTNSYDVVTLLIGVNNQYQGGSINTYQAEFSTLVQRSIQYARGNASHVVVISIPDYSVTPFAKGSNTALIASQIDAFNNVNQSVAAAYRVGYLNVTEASRKAATDLSLIAADSLHFSGKEYGIWSNMLAPVIKTILQ